VPLSKIQSEVLRLLAAHRDPESYVGGATPLNQFAPRFSEDIDVFHDRQERIVEAALNDAAVLEGDGYRVEWLRQLPMIYTAAVTKGDDGARLEWVVDSNFRFFPTVPDEVFHRCHARTERRRELYLSRLGGQEHEVRHRFPLILRTEPRQLETAFAGIYIVGCVRHSFLGRLNSRPSTRRIHEFPICRRHSCRELPGLLPWGGAKPERTTA
jgi:hypothetical protein